MECPFCGSEKIIGYGDIENELTHMMCQGCGVRVPAEVWAVYEERLLDERESLAADMEGKRVITIGEHDLTTIISGLDIQQQRVAEGVKQGDVMAGQYYQALEEMLQGLITQAASDTCQGCSLGLEIILSERQSRRMPGLYHERNH